MYPCYAEVGSVLKSLYYLGKTILKLMKFPCQKHKESIHGYTQPHQRAQPPQSQLGAGGVSRLTAPLTEPAIGLDFAYFKHT